MDMNYRGGMWWGGQDGVEWGGNGTTNSIINKYIKKTKEKDGIIK